MFKIAKDNSGARHYNFIKDNVKLLKDRNKDFFTPLQVSVLEGSVNTAFIFIQLGGMGAVRAKFYSKKNKSSLLHYCLMRGWNTPIENDRTYFYSDLIKRMTLTLKERVFYVRDVYGLNVLGLATLSGQKEAIEYFTSLPWCKKSLIEYEMSVMEKLR